MAEKRWPKQAKEERGRSDEKRPSESQNSSPFIRAERCKTFVLLESCLCYFAPRWGISRRRDLELRLRPTDFADEDPRKFKSSNALNGPGGLGQLIAVRPGRCKSQQCFSESLNERFPRSKVLQVAGATAKRSSTEQLDGKRS